MFLAAVARGMVTSNEYTSSKQNMASKLFAEVCAYAQQARYCTGKLGMYVRMTTRVYGIRERPPLHWSNSSNAVCATRRS
jgi:hypothetical protein